MSTLKNYKQQFDTLAGDNLTKVKTLIEHNVDQWSLEDESMLIDLLDDKSVTAEDIVDALSEMVAYEEGNTLFKNAVLAMHLGLEKSRLSLANLFEVKENFGEDQEGETDNIVPLFTGATSEELPLAG